METTVLTPCVECGRPEAGRFCAECGAEQEEELRLPPIRHFLLEAVRDVTELDSQLLATIGALLRRPGELTRAFVRGPRYRYLRPLKVFFLANVLYFFAAGLVNVATLATPLRLQLTSAPGLALKEGLVAQKLRQKKIDEPGLAPSWDAITQAHARTLVILMVPLYGLVFGALLWWTRRPGLQHLVFATHFTSFYLVLLSALCGVVALLRPAMQRGWIAPVTDGEMTIFMLLAISAYTYLAVRRAYDVGRLPALAVTIGAGVLALPVLLLYRFLLFLTVWAVV